MERRTKVGQDQPVCHELGINLVVGEVGAAV